MKLPLTRPSAPEILLSELKAELESARAHSVLEELASLHQSDQTAVSLKVRSGEWLGAN